MELTQTQGAHPGKGDRKLKDPLTIVLPLHNVERQIWQIVQDTLEVAQSVSPSISVVLVDDGSTDGTYEEACALARHFPQIKTLRHPIRSGLGAVINLARSNISADRILLHDGISPIDTTRLNQMLRSHSSHAAEGMPGKPAAAIPRQRSGHQFSEVTALDKSMRQNHQSIVEFQWIRMDRLPSTRHPESERHDPAPSHAAGVPIPPPVISQGELASPLSPIFVEY
jgi:glycosyl transferase family 2